MKHGMVSGSAYVTSIFGFAPEPIVCLCETVQAVVVLFNVGSSLGGAHSPKLNTILKRVIAAAQFATWFVQHDYLERENKENVHNTNRLWSDLKL